MCWTLKTIGGYVKAKTVLQKAGDWAKERKPLIKLGRRVMQHSHRPNCEETDMNKKER